MIMITWLGLWNLWNIVSKLEYLLQRDSSHLVKYLCTLLIVCVPPSSTAQTMGMPLNGRRFIDLIWEWTISIRWCSSYRLIAWCQYLNYCFTVSRGPSSDSQGTPRSACAIWDPRHVWNKVSSSSKRVLSKWGWKKMRMQLSPSSSAVISEQEVGMVAIQTGQSYKFMIIVQNNDCDGADCHSVMSLTGNQNR